MGLTEIPEGFKTLLPEEAERRKRVLSFIEEVIRVWGYEPIVPPSIEFLSPFKVVDERLEELSFKIVDRVTGKLMAVRPDFTPQVARIVASSFKNEEPPFRFYYSGKIFRDVPGEREIFQFGFELMGVKETEGDAEIVAVVVNILEKLGLRSFQIDIGHSEFVEGVLEELEIPDREEFLKLLAHKDLSGIELFLEERSIRGSRREKILHLMELYGKEEVLGKAKELFKNERSRKALKELEEMFAILRSYGFEKRVIFDLSEKRGMKYHTGVTFEVFHPLFGSSLGAGGRYDQLVGKFGRELPATGMALNVDALQLLLEKKGLFESHRKDFYIIDLKKELHKAYEVARALRERGYIATRDIVRRDFRRSMKTAFDKGYRFVVILNREGVPRHLLYTSPEEFFELDERDIPGSILNLIDKV
jgi:ATP phosphoribosyltransferase regulatory subunit